MGQLVIDGMNVVGSRPTGWWRDRDAAVLELVERLVDLAVRTGEQITAVFDGRLPAGLEEGQHEGIEVLAARRGGPNSADDRIVEFVRTAADAEALTVVTADRTLRDRVRRLGARCEGPRWLLEQLEGSG